MCVCVLVYMYTIVYITSRLQSVQLLSFFIAIFAFHLIVMSINEHGNEEKNVFLIKNRSFHSDSVAKWLNIIISVCSILIYMTTAYCILLFLKNGEHFIFHWMQFYTRNSHFHWLEPKNKNTIRTEFIYLFM